MNLKLRLSAAFALSFLCAAAFGALALFVRVSQINRFDSTVIRLVQSMESPSMTAVMKLFSFVGSGAVIAFLVPVIAFCLYRVLGHRRELVLFVGVVIGSALLNWGLKAVFHRARPTIHRIVEATGYSFPSGHSMSAFTLYGIIAFLLWRHTSPASSRIALIAFSSAMIVAIGLSRIYLGVHYPSDVLGGYLASGSWLAIAIWVYQKDDPNPNKIKLPSPSHP
ncbi:phosphatase PAP2 family protein [Paenibacillus piri]|uniref:phosphatase PAP2 family protein n=1 Tax=Paenibacillus piri TaxID=2547395 RepID=UPI001FE9DD87|nr:phosphatase PAP2 family protein [Paenibacillus piri]